MVMRSVYFRSCASCTRGKLENCFPEGEARGTTRPDNILEHRLADKIRFIASLLSVEIGVKKNCAVPHSVMIIESLLIIDADDDNQHNLD